MDQPLKLGKSSQIHSGTYDPQTERLTLVLNGGTYAYHNISPEIANGLEKADSHGDFFHQNIRTNKDIKFSRVR